MTRGAEEKVNTLADVTWRPPRKETERLVLPGFEPTDETAVFDYASDPEVTPHMLWDRHPNVEHTRTVYLNGHVVSCYAREVPEYALCEKGREETVIGGMGLYVRDAKAGVLEIGYVLSRSHWGKGYVPEAARYLIAQAFETTNAYRIYAPIFGENEKSRRAAEKMGMTLDGVLRGHYFIRGVRRDSAIYSILRPEYESGGLPS